MLSIHFNSTKKIGRSILIEVFLSIARILKIIPVVDFYDEGLTLNEPGKDNTLYVEEKEKDDGQFRFGYAIFFRSHPGLNLRKKIDFLMLLAKQANVDILVDEGDVNPYTFIRVNSIGEAHKVGVAVDPYNERDELTIEMFCPDVFGSFATTLDLNNAQLHHLKTSWRQSFSVSDIQKIEARFYFEDYRDRFPNLKEFNHYYFVMPEERTQWLSRDERSEILLDTMTAFANETGIRICLFPANSTTIENIPGGSDSESFCLTIVNGLLEKTIFKPRRKSWLPDAEH